MRINYQSMFELRPQIIVHAYHQNFGKAATFDGGTNLSLFFIYSKKCLFEICKNTLLDKL